MFIPPPRRVGPHLDGLSERGGPAARGHHSSAAPAARSAGVLPAALAATAGPTAGQLHLLLVLVLVVEISIHWDAGGREAVCAI